MDGLRGELLGGLNSASDSLTSETQMPDSPNTRFYSHPNSFCAEYGSH